MGISNKREVDLVVLSDIHLALFGCNAEALLTYLKSIQPKTIILNGDIIDIWQFKKRYFPGSHMKVIKQFTNFMSKGSKVYYVTGNHDELLRKFNGFSMGNFTIVNHLVLNLDGKKTWIFHGDVFDTIIQNSKWLAHLGSVSYDLLLLLNHFVNKTRRWLGKEPVQLSKKIKDNVKQSLKYINDFEMAAAQQGIKKGVDAIVCGHIHKPQKRTITTPIGDIEYLNSGDWIENLSALEYHNGEWTIHYEAMEESKKKKKNVDKLEIEELEIVDLDNKRIFSLFMEEVYGSKDRSAS